jgi:hypothetical protein
MPTYAGAPNPCCLGLFFFILYLSENKFKKKYVLNIVEFIIQIRGLTD